ncbi:MAG: phospholipase [Haloplasmataceae bacterium]|nr:phospholipase [Haloplasmataceae bacterium]
MKVNLVFEGGGILGISFVGAYKALTEKGYEIENCAGVSAGSIFSALITSGYSADELIEIMEKTDFKMFLNKTKLSKLFLLGKPLSLIKNKGIYNCDIIEKWIDNLLKQKGISTFDNVMINNESKLKIIVADVTNRRIVVIPDDLLEYGINPSEFKISKAVMMSSSIPLFYTPLKLTFRGKDAIIVDGGLLSALPIWVFDKKSKLPTFGIKIEDQCSNSSIGKNGIFKYISDLVTASLNQDEMSYVREKDRVRIINLENDNTIHGTNFELNRKQIRYLYDSGYNSMKKFLENWTYVSYVKRFLI